MRTVPTIGNLTLVLVLVFAVLAPASDLAFTHIQMGDSVPDLQLRRLDGDEERYLGPETSQARVFAFVKPDHERSAALINQWAELQAAFADQPVHWVLVISDRHNAGATADWDSLAPGATVLVDTNDQLYGELGVPLTPVVGIADESGVLRAYLPYRRINYRTIITAHVRQVLGTISAEEMERLLNPSGGVADSLLAGAKRRLKLGRMLLNRERLDAAETQVEEALGDCPNLAEGYLLLADIHRAAGRTAEADQAATRAQQLAATTAATPSDSTSGTSAVADSSSLVRPE